MNLEEARKEIDSIDRELVKLFEARFKAVEEVIRFKMENNLPILDSGREASILEKNMALVEDENLKPYFKDFYQDLMKVSKEYQEYVKNKSIK